MQERTPAEATFGPKSNYLFAQNLGERARLERQFHLFQEDFDLWFGEAILVTPKRLTAAGERLCRNSRA